MVSIVSAIFGDYDKVKPVVPQSVECTWTLVTDNPGNADGDWNVEHIVDFRHPRLAAKDAKLRPWRYAPSPPWIWIDGSFEVTSPTFVEEAIAASKGAPIAQWAHPWRSCIFDEAVESAKLAKYASTPVLDQAEHYRRTGHPAGWGLWAAGFVVYRHPLDYLADLWEAEIREWGIQDQISQPVALRNAGLRPVSLPGGLHRSPWLRWHPHRSEL